MVSCPVCEADIDLDEDDLDEGDVVSCDECGASLNVTGLEPLELESDEDDEDDEYFESDDEDDEDDDEEDEEDEEENW
jgi:alpha-aminoadipate carrier protein LysW